MVIDLLISVMESVVYQVTNPSDNFPTTSLHHKSQHEIDLLYAVVFSST